jgi:hypothetical protein
MNDQGDVSDFDPRTDPMAPPAEPCECYCLHCGRVFMSDQMWFQRVINARDGFAGFWMCATPNCDGAGFTFDIFPTDPSHPANDGWSDDDGEDLGEDTSEDADTLGEHIAAELEAEADNQSAEWDPDESKYKEFDEEFGDEDDDLEGEEWKLGLAPGERPPEPDWAQEARRDWEEEQKKYDEPDQRPRVVDWSDREDVSFHNGGEFTDDDIPF